MSSNGFGLGLFPCFLGLIAGGALLAGCGQVRLVFRGNPARFYFGDNLIGGLID